MYETRFLPLNLQFFADDAGDNDNNGGSEEGGQGDGQQTPGEQNGDAANTGDSGEKTLPQSKVNSLVADERRNTQASILKQLGDFESLDDAKAALQKLKDIEDSQKTEAQKQAERLQEYETQSQKLANENESLKAQMAAITAGVQSDAVQDVVTLAKPLVSDEMDMNAAIAKVLEKYPHFKGGSSEEDDTAFYTVGDHKKQTKTDSFASALFGK
ncbi:hypothetical protein ACTHQC_07425 [Bacillus paralicheniformis]|uniref:hypothetical protein n=1 Tax=Bacillus paralicheniformis TaxID=1648923 RepID=UPI003F7C27DD